MNKKKGPLYIEHKFNVKGIRITTIHKNMINLQKYATFIHQTPIQCKGYSNHHFNSHKKQKNFMTQKPSFNVNGIQITTSNNVIFIHKTHIPCKGLKLQLQFTQKSKIYKNKM